MSETRPFATILVPEVLVFTYRNYRGEVGKRRVRVSEIRFGTSRYHPEPQWLLRGLDMELGKIREFAMKDMTEVVNEDG